MHRSGGKAFSAEHKPSTLHFMTRVLVQGHQELFGLRKGKPGKRPAFCYAAEKEDLLTLVLVPGFCYKHHKSQAGPVTFPQRLRGE